MNQIDHSASQRAFDGAVERLERADSQASDAMQALSDTLRAVSDAQARMVERIERYEAAASVRENAIVKSLERVAKIVGGDDGTQGLALRIDRVEQAQLRAQRVANWILGGGLVSFVASVTLLVKIFGAVAR